MIKSLRRLLFVVALSGSGVVASACGGSTPAPSHPVTGSGNQVKPEDVYAAPAGLIAEAAPMPNGVMWLLSGTASVRTLGELNLATGRLLQSLPESTAAVTLAQSNDGDLAVGIATAHAGAVEIRDGSSGDLISTVAVGAPVHQVAFGPAGATLYVLNGNSTSSSVTLVDADTATVEGTIPVALDAVSVASSPDGSDLWILEQDGAMDEVTNPGGQEVAKFPVGTSGIDVSVSPDGTTLYVLKGSSSVGNVAVVDAATESMQKVLPAPADCVGITLSPDGQTIYDAVGTPSIGNIQAFAVSASAP